MMEFLRITENVLSRLRSLSDETALSLIASSAATNATSWVLAFSMFKMSYSNKFLVGVAVGYWGLPAIFTMIDFLTDPASFFEVNDWVKLLHDNETM